MHSSLRLMDTTRQRCAQSTSHSYRRPIACWNLQSLVQAAARKEPVDVIRHADLTDSPYKLD